MTALDGEPKPERNALLKAGEQLRADGNGLDGLTGFFVAVGREDPAVLRAWIANLAPREVNKVDENGEVVENPMMVINIVGVPSGTFLSKEECEAAMLAELPLLEHEPAVIDNDDDELPPVA